MSIRYAVSLFALTFLALASADSALAAGKTGSTVCAPCIEQNERTLASDAMRGRGSATEDEAAAARFIAGKLKEYGVAPFDPKGYIQEVEAAVDLSKIPLDQLPPSMAGGFKKAVHDGKLHTRNVIGILWGSDPRLKGQTILLSAHMDHLGTQPENAVQGDGIFNGADDDASGTTAVLELARALAHGARLKRTVVFVFFGSEELGGFGNRYFLEHPPVALTQIIANLEFEMIGRPDPAVAAHTLWLTGYERTDLGPALAQHGAHLVADPHPDQHFFKRSDNYALAKRGIVAQTVSSFGLHPQYHKPDDDLAHIDFQHMTEAIGSMLQPVRWLADSDFKPEWADGMKP